MITRLEGTTFKVKTCSTSPGLSYPYKLISIEYPVGVFKTSLIILQNRFIHLEATEPQIGKPLIHIASKLIIPFFCGRRLKKSITANS